MVTDHLITFTAKPRQMRSLLFNLHHWERDLNSLGYLLSRYCARWRHPDDENVLVCRWMMTGSDAFTHAWNKETRHAVLDTRADVGEVLAKAPQVRKLKPAESVRSCRCSATSRKALDLWRRVDSGPPLLCCKGGFIPMYRLPFSLPTCSKLEEWHDLAGHAFELFRGGGETPTAVRQFVDAVAQCEDSLLMELGREIAAAVKDETGRKVNLYSPPYHLYDYPIKSFRSK